MGACYPGNNEPLRGYTFFDETFNQTFYSYNLSNLQTRIKYRQQAGKILVSQATWKQTRYIFTPSNYQHEWKDHISRTTYLESLLDIPVPYKTFKIYVDQQERNKLEKLLQ